MTATETFNNEHLRQLVNEYSDDRVCLLEIIRFWVRHPSTRFNQPAILHSLDCEDSRHIQIALAYLITRSVVVENHQSQVSYYQLTETEPLRSELLNLSQREWSRQNLIEKNLVQRGEVYA